MLLFHDGFINVSDKQVTKLLTEDIIKYVGFVYLVH